MHFDIYQEKLLSHPNEVYQELHAYGSVLRGSTPLPEFGDCWYVIGYREALTVLRSDDFIHDRSKVFGNKPLSSYSGSTKQFWESMTEWPLFLDPPEHSQKRLQLANFFKEQSIQSLQVFIEQECNRLLGNAIANGEFDLMWDFSYPLTLSVICRVMGISTPNTIWFKQHIAELANALDFRTGEYSYVPAIDAVNQLNDFLAQEIENTKGKNGLCDKLMQQGATKQEIVSLLLQLLFAGQETSADAIGNLMIELDCRRDLWQKLVNDHHLAAQVCKESLRYKSSLQFSGIRTAARNVELGGSSIKKGDAVVIAIGACNQDPRHFEDPMTFNHERETSGPELTFGHGIHYCLGVHLARMELQIALKTLANRLPASWRTHESVMRKNIVFRGPTSLRISTS